MSTENILQQWVRDNLSPVDGSDEQYSLTEIRQQFYLDTRNYISGAVLYDALVAAGYECQDKRWFVIER